MTPERSAAPRLDQPGGPPTNTAPLHNDEGQHSRRTAYETALRLAERGYVLTPVTIRRRADDGRKAVTFHRDWRQDPAGTSTDPEVIRDWQVQHPDCSFAIVCGPSGIEVVDLDAKDHGPEKWAARDMPCGSVVVATPGGGMHHYWRRRDGAHLPTTAGKIAAGIDSRSIGGVVFAPGGYVVGEEDRPYTVQGDLPKAADLDPTPAAVLDAWAAHQTAERERSGATTTHDYDWAVQRCREQRRRVREHDTARHGGFRDVLMGAALMVGRMVDAGVITEQAATRGLLDDVAQAWGQPDGDDREWIRRGLVDGPATERWQITGQPAQAADELPAAAPDPFETDLAKELMRRRVRKAADAIERPPAQPPASVSIRALLAEPDEDTEWRIAELMGRDDKVMLTAPRKSGKTTMTGNLVKSLVDGTPFLDRFDVAPMGARRVFLADFEMPRRKIRKWSRDHHIGNADGVHVEFLRGRTWDIRVPEVREQWAEHMRALDVGLLMVDPLGPALFALGIDENDNTEVGGFLFALDALVAAAGVSELFVTHHTGHAGERGRGASVLRGWPDAEWRITKGGDEVGAARFLAAEGRDVALPETALTYDPPTRRLSLGQGDRSTHRVDIHAGAVAELVAEHPGVTSNALEAAVKKSCRLGSTPARELIRSVVDSGVIHVHPGLNRSRLHHPGERCGKCP